MHRLGWHLRGHKAPGKACARRGLPLRPSADMPWQQRIRGGGCRYDVKYGSAGFNSYGYKGGCAFAQGTYAEMMADPAASRYLCPKSMDSRYMCLHDFSGDGVCFSSELWDGVFRVQPVRHTTAGPALPL